MVKAIIKKDIIAFLLGVIALALDDINRKILKNF